MRHSQVYYHQRKLLRELTYNDKKFRPTVGDCYEWFVILNAQIFGNKLNLPTKISTCKSTDWAHAVYSYYGKNNSNYPKTEIKLMGTYRNKKFFVEVLAHEMIHHFQNSYNEPVSHGPSFWAWREHFQLKGLTLNRIYDI